MTMTAIKTVIVIAIKTGVVALPQGSAKVIENYAIGYQHITFY